MKLRRLISMGLMAAWLSAAAVAACRDSPPTVSPSQPPRLPAPALRALPNGLKLVIVERRSLPLVTLRLVVKAGAEADEPDLPGAAEMVASLLDQGTALRSAQQIAQAIDEAGGGSDRGADWDNSFLELSVLSDHAEAAFDLLSDLIAHPAFAAAEVERQRKQALSALEVARQDPAYLADTIFGQAVFSGSSYGHPADGTLEALRRLTPEDLRRFYARNYRPSNSILALVGDLSGAEGFALAEKYFAGWKGEKAAPAAPATPAETAGRRRVIVIDKPDAVQTEIRVGNSAISRSSPDYFALTLANQILGGPATNRLFRALRSEHGLAYGASSDLDCRQRAGSWEAKTSTRTPETLKSLDVVLEEMKRLRDQPISQEELEAAQSYLTGHLALEFESSEGIATQLLDLMVHDLPLDYWNTFPQEIRKVTPEDVWNAARRHLDPERSVIVLVGNASGFDKGLKKLGPTRTIPLASVDLASPNFERASPSARNPFAPRP